jgi:hypothetical protein
LGHGQCATGADSTPPKDDSDLARFALAEVQAPARARLVGPDGSYLDIPDESYGVLRDVVTALSEGLAISIAPQAYNARLASLHVPSSLASSTRWASRGRSVQSARRTLATRCTSGIASTVMWVSTRSGIDAEPTRSLWCVRARCGGCGLVRSGIDHGHELAVEGMAHDVARALGQVGCGGMTLLPRARIVPHHEVGEPALDLGIGHGERGVERRLVRFACPDSWYSMDDHRGCPSLCLWVSLRVVRRLGLSYRWAW